MIYLYSIFIHLFVYSNYRILFVNILRLHKRNTFSKINFGIIFIYTSIAQLPLITSCSWVVFTSTCGRGNPKGLRIVGGVATKPHEFPWMAALYHRNRGPFCGGSLLNDKYVITAAHCIDGLRPQDLSVNLGEHITNKRNDYRKKIRATRVILHSEYKESGYINDIGLIKLMSTVKFSESQRPPCLLRPAVNLDGVPGVVSGWGVTKEGGHSSRVLRKVSSPVISLNKCRKYLGSNLILSTNICSLVKEGGKDACQGDSGGPLMYNVNNRHYLIGIISWGIGCARPNNPAVYTRIDKYYSWIDRNTADAVFCSD